MFLCSSYARLDDNSDCVETGEVKVSKKNYLPVLFIPVVL